MGKHERYREQHPDRVKESHTTHYHRHRDVICECKRLRYAEHREAILQRMKERSICPLCHKELTKRYSHAHMLRKHGPDIQLVA